MERNLTYTRLPTAMTVLLRKATWYSIQVAICTELRLKAEPITMVSSGRSRRS